MKDFIFGTLATEELRLEHVRNRRAGVSHYQARSPLDPRPGQQVTLQLTIGPDFPFDKAWVYWTNDGSDPAGKSGFAQNGFATSMERVDIEWDTSLWGYRRRFKGSIPGQPADTVIRYYLSAGSNHGEEMIADHGSMYGYYVDDDPPPDWCQEAICYEIFVDRFFPGKGKAWLNPKTPAGFYGGTIRGITEKMDYLCELGVNVLWLTPIFPSPSHHGYDASDLFDIEPRLGNKADLKELLDESHQRGIRILLDLVPNHVSNLHPTFQSAVTDKNSPYQNWYTFTHWPDKYRTFFGVAELPQLNLREPAARKHVLDCAAFWLDFGVDGFRVDYAIGPTPDFWADFRRVTRKTNPDCWTFGEVVEPPDSQLAFHGELDGCLDFSLLEAFRNAFAFREWDGNQFASFLTRHEDYFPESFSRPSFLDNHDMNRFLWAAEGEMRQLRLAALCQFSLSGAPIIYYGTEVGLSQIRDVRQDGRGLPEEARLPMLWGGKQNAGLFDYYRNLIKLRKKHAELRHGKANMLYVDKNVLIYQKGRSNNLVVALNLSQDTQTITIDEKPKDILHKTNEGDLLSSEGKITLSPMSGKILTDS